MILFVRACLYNNATLSSSLVYLPFYVVLFVVLKFARHFFSLHSVVFSFRHTVNSILPFILFFRTARVFLYSPRILRVIELQQQCQVKVNFNFSISHSFLLGYNTNSQSPLSPIRYGLSQLIFLFSFWVRQKWKVMRVINSVSWYTFWTT